MRRIFAALFAAAMVCVLAGCGSTADALWYGVVTGPEGITDGSVAYAVASGITSYAAETSRRTQNYQAAEDTEDGYKAAFKQAAEDGLTYAFAVGSSMEIPVYHAQSAHHGMRFVLFDGEPRASEDSEAAIRGNTECVRISDEGYGFAAGYAAVRGGCRNLAFLAAKNEGAAKDHFTGFVQGAETAASELSLGDGAVTVKCEFAGTDELTPLRETDALRLYNGGTEIIVTDSETISRAVEAAAASLDKRCAGIGFDHTASSSYFLFAVGADYSNAASALLARFDEKDGFDGGKTVELGLSAKAYSLSVDWSRFSDFTEADFDAMLDRAAAGDITCMTTEEAEKESLDEATGLNAATKGNAGVAVEMTDPVSPNGSSGISGAASSAESTSSAAEAVSSSAGTEESTDAAGDTAEAESASAGSVSSGTEEITPDSSDD